MIVAPANWMNGIAERAATAMQDQIGVCNRGLTRASGLDPGSWSSRDIPKHNRTVEVMIDMQQTKIAAETTRKYTVANALDKFASMMVCGPTKFDVLMASFMLGTAMRVPHRKMAPMMNAPMIEASTALGASRLGS